MPKVYYSDIDREYHKQLNNLKCELYKFGIRNKEIGEWLNLEPQTVGRHFKNGTFSYRQFFTMEYYLKLLQSAA